jgi:acetylornithine/succinyldiaminopimelate/putrescine aminotransferase
MMAVEFEDFDMNKKVIDALIVCGVFTDWFLFAANCLRIVPPLIISDEEITVACNKICRVLDEL